MNLQTKSPPPSIYFCGKTLLRPLEGDLTKPPVRHRTRASSGNEAAIPADRRMRLRISLRARGERALKRCATCPRIRAHGDKRWRDGPIGRTDAFPRSERSPASAPRRVDSSPLPRPPPSPPLRTPDDLRPASTYLPSRQTGWKSCWHTRTLARTHARGEGGQRTSPAAHSNSSAG